MKLDIDIDLRTVDIDIKAMLARKGPHRAAVIYATNEVGRQSRTAVRTAIAQELQVSVKSIRRRTEYYRATFKKPWGRLWAGNKIGIALYEGGTLNKGVHAHAPAGTPTFIRTMKSGHKGLFFRSTRGGAPRTGKRLSEIAPNDLPIKEVRINGREVARVFNEKMPDIARAKWRDRFDEIYDKDLDRRLRKRGWR